MRVEDVDFVVSVLVAVFCCNGLLDVGDKLNVIP